MYLFNPSIITTKGIKKVKELDNNITFAINHSQPFTSLFDKNHDIKSSHYVYKGDYFNLKNKYMDISISLDHNLLVYNLNTPGTFIIKAHELYEKLKNKENRFFLVQPTYKMVDTLLDNTENNNNKINLLEYFMHYCEDDFSNYDFVVIPLVNNKKGVCKDLENCGISFNITGNDNRENPIITIHNIKENMDKFNRFIHIHKDYFYEESIEIYVGYNRYSSKYEKALVFYEKFSYSMEDFIYFLRNHLDGIVNLNNHDYQYVVKENVDILCIHKPQFRNDMVASNKLWNDFLKYVTEGYRLIPEFINHNTNINILSKYLYDIKTSDVKHVLQTRHTDNFKKVCSILNKFGYPIKYTNMTEIKRIIEYFKIPSIELDITNFIPKKTDNYVDGYEISKNDKDLNDFSFLISNSNTFCYV